MADKDRTITRDELDELAADLLPERTQMSVIWHAGPAPVSPEDIGVPTEPDGGVDAPAETT
jgi:hypothetical protein